MDRMNRGFRPSFAPVKVGDEMDVEIESVGEKGDGIAKIKGFVIFVPNTKKGDKVKIRVTRVLRKVAFGEVVSESSGESSDEEESSEDEEESEGESYKEDSDDSKDSEDSEEYKDSEEF